MTAPESGLQELLVALGAGTSYDPTAVASVRASSVGRGRAALTEEQRERWAKIAGPTLQRTGYGA